MSGICGIVHLDGAPADRGLLTRLTDGLKFRGPDRQDVWAKGPAGLGHTLLRTTPESEHERQPCTLDGRVWITADARIDGWGDLKRKLEAAGQCVLEGVTDAGLILHAYDAWGERCVEHLIGDFAFAIWDGRRQALFCARDHFGVKPFCYCRLDGEFIFSSEVRALLRLKQVPRHLNEGRICDYFADLEGYDLTSTFYQDIQRLPPATTLTVGRGAWTTSSYWTPRPQRGLACTSDGEYADAFLEVFSEAVKCRLRSAGRVGSMLSGGMDSSSIVGVARRELLGAGKAPLMTFSGVSEADPDCAETRSIGLVLGQGGVERHTISPEQTAGLAAELGRLQQEIDDPFVFPFTLPQVMYIFARRQNVKVVLDGVDGDLVASLGSGYLAHLVREGKWRVSLREAVGLARFLTDHPSPCRLLARAARTAFTPAGARRVWRKLRRARNCRAVVKNTAINGLFARRIGLAERLHDYERHGGDHLLPTLTDHHVGALVHPHLTAALERYDRVAALYSVEPRHPFLDVRLVEFCLALPWEQKVHDGWSKIALRRAMDGILPDEVRWRRGWEHLGYRFNYAWMAAEKGRIEEILTSDLRYAATYLDVEKAREFGRRYLAGKAADQDIEELWRALNILLFLKKNLIHLPYG